MALCLEGPTPGRPRVTAGALVLADADADTYVGRLVAAVAAARLNSFFPPATTLGRHLGFLGPAGSHGLYPELHVARENGLPTAREILRVKIDHDLAPTFLEEAARRPSPPAGSRLGRRIAYYRQLGAGPVLAVDRMLVEVRQAVPEEGLAYLRLILDRFDLASNQFVRYTILLAQRDAFWRRQGVAVDDDLAAPTEAFRRIAHRFTSHEAEVAFILLARLPGIEVEDVRRCRVGPLLLPGARVGPALEGLLAQPGAWALCFPEDRAGREVAANSSGDPMASLMRDAVGEESRALYDAKADELGYRVAKSRKFVCPAALVGPLAGLCRELGAPSVVRGVG